MNLNFMKLLFLFFSSCCLLFTTPLFAQYQQVPPQSAPPLKKPLGNNAFPAPEILFPQDGKLLPPYSTIRLSWKPVPGAKSYRIQLWEEDSMQPRWITEVKENWLIIKDAPYSSYMYLQGGIYRWDVAAMDPKLNENGHIASSSFEMTRQYFLSEHELFFKTRYGYSPIYRYVQANSVLGTSYDFNVSAHSADLSLDWWMSRQWGLSFSFGTSEQFRINYLGKDLGNVNFIYADIDFLWRAYLSLHPLGWTLGAQLGLVYQEFPQVESVLADLNKTSIVRPKSLCPKFGFKINKRLTNSWEMEFSSFVFMPVVVFGNYILKYTPSYGTNLHLYYSLSKSFSLGFGPSFERRKLTYKPSSYVQFTNTAIHVIARIRL